MRSKVHSPFPPISVALICTSLSVLGSLSLSINL